MNKVVLIVCLSLVALVYGRQGFGPGEQEWGFEDVREGAHLFWWLYYTTANVSNYTDRPLVIWLQGGPGASSTGYGNFAELGPLDHELNPRNFTWVKDVNVLFVDNPVGSGFSYTDSNAQLTTTNRQIAEDFVELLKGFYAKNPEFAQTPLYILCESYGGKMTAEIALVLYEAIQNQELDIIFEGVGLGDSWVSPIDSVLTWGPYLLQLGAIDEQGLYNIELYANSTKDAVDAGRWTQATNLWSYTESAIFYNTYGIDFYNVLKKISSGYKFNPKSAMIKPSLRDDVDDQIERIMLEQVTSALNISSPRFWGEQSGIVFNTLSEDFMKPVTEIVERLLNETDIQVFVYNGQLDLIVDTPGTIKWVDELNWIGSADWSIAQRNGFVVDGYYEGYVKQARNLAFYWVDRAGHMVPADNPNAMDYILRDLTNNYEGRKRN